MNLYSLHVVGVLQHVHDVIVVVMSVRSAIILEDSQNTQLTIDKYKETSLVILVGLEPWYMNKSFKNIIELLHLLQELQCSIYGHAIPRQVAVALVKSRPVLQKEFISQMLPLCLGE